MGTEISAHSPNGDPGGKDVSPSDPALIIYTSGTTGTPKGVVLSHQNILSNIEGVIPYFEFNPEDHFLSLLPLSHTLEFTAGFVLPLTFGATITYLRAPVASEITTTMKEVSPTVFIAVPLVYKHLHKGIMRRLASLPTMSRAFMSLAKRISFLRPTLARRIAEAFGGKMRYWIVGGAPIDPNLLLDLELMGIEVLQGYGLSEASPLLTVNPPGRNRRGTVGLPLTNVRVKIAASPGEERGEILAQGDNIMTGYYRNRKATSEAIRDGWLHTGDVGILDEAGYLTIVGREKNMIVTPGGENVYPEEIETLLERCHLVKEISVFGQKEGDGVGEKVCAVVVPDLEVHQALPKDERKRPVETLLEEEIRTILKTVAPYKRIAEWVLHPDELPKTPLRKKKMDEIRRFFSEKRKQKTGVKAG
ncbi:MAG: AMP-binding protein [Armatimonadetes bacterium]|nr:AMP-binding protein [Armatimonadota bacterium]